MFCHGAFRVFEFLGEALVILHHRHDNFRVIRITYFSIGLINIWRQLRFGSPSFFSMTYWYGLLMDLSVFLYAHFETSLYRDFPEIRARVEQLICAMEVTQMLSICMEVLSVGNKDSKAEQFSEMFKWYMFWYTTLTVVMLAIISQNALTHVNEKVEKKKTSKVLFKNYGSMSLGGVAKPHKDEENLDESDSTSETSSSESTSSRRGSSSSTIITNNT